MQTFSTLCVEPNHCVVQDSAAELHYVPSAHLSTRLAQAVPIYRPGRLKTQLCQNQTWLLPAICQAWCCYLLSLVLSHYVKSNMIVPVITFYRSPPKKGHMSVLAFLSTFWSALRWQTMVGTDKVLFCRFLELLTSQASSHAPYGPYLPTCDHDVHCAGHDCKPMTQMPKNPVDDHYYTLLHIITIIEPSILARIMDNQVLFKLRSSSTRHFRERR